MASTGKNPKSEIYKFLMNYRNTPHSSTGKTPASLMMNRGIKTKIPTIIPAPTTVAHKEAQQKDAAAKARQKEYADKHRRATDRQYKVGDTVLLHQKKTTINMTRTHSLSHTPRAPRSQPPGGGRRSPAMWTNGKF